MERLNDILRELGISKVKLAKCLGVSRQMIYNYLELDDLNKWPKDKKVILLNILGIKSADELDDIKVDTDYIMDVEMRINSLFENSNKSDVADNNAVFSGLGIKQKELLHNIIDEVIVLIMRAPRSYTKEDVVELQCIFKFKNEGEVSYEKTNVMGDRDGNGSFDVCHTCKRNRGRCVTGGLQHDAYSKDHRFFSR